MAAPSANRDRTGGSEAARYTRVAIVLHWLIAALIVTLLAAGLWMTEAIRQPATQAFAYQVYQWHKAIGLSVLVLTLVRLGWRLAHPAPPLPATMSPLARRAAHVAHGAFYALMLAIPLAGWAMVSASPLGLPTIIFGLFEWPHIPWLAALSDKAGAEAALKTGHRLMAYGLGVLVAVHVGAALKHQFLDRDAVLGRMLPGVSGPEAVQR